MDVLYNGSGVPQVFYDLRCDTVTIPPRFAYVPDSLNKNQAQDFQAPFSSLRPFIEKAEKILFARNYALGDLLMLVPVLREFRAVYPNKKISLATTYDLSRNYFVQYFFKGLVDSFHSNYQTVEGYDLGILLDDVVERDHRMKRYSCMHRVDIYRECLSLPTGERPVWATEPTWVGLHGVVFCSGGRTPIKQLSSVVTEYFLRQLGRRKFRKLVHVRDGMEMPPAEFLGTLRNARVLITMDTAPLWLAHFTNTPVVLISGATRGAERLSYHPLYSDGAKEVSFSKVIGCSPCFESEPQCRKVPRCFSTLSEERMWEMVEKTMEEVMWTN